MKTHLVIPDPHAHPDHHNERAIWLGELIKDVRPDVVINLGDTADLPSICTIDQGKLSYQGRSYAADIAAHGDFQERLWGTVRKAKRKMPRRVTLIGNHEQRIERAIDRYPEMKGTVGYEDLELDRWYDTVVPYSGNTPGVIQLDGIYYAHFFVSGVQGRAIGGEHPAYSLLTKEYVSCTQGHTHVFDYARRTNAGGGPINGCVAGVFQDYLSDWAGEVNKLWWRGVLIKRRVEGGDYSLQQVSMQELKKLYG